MDQGSMVVGASEKSLLMVIAECCMSCLLVRPYFPAGSLWTHQVGLMQKVLTLCFPYVRKGF